jgi:lysophospholipase L1-like esterase
LQKYHSTQKASTLAALLAFVTARGCSKVPSRDPVPPSSSARPEAPSDAGRSWAPQRYVAIGDSFTIGTGATPEQSFPARFAAHFPGAKLLNLGVNGYTTSDVIERELPHAGEFGADFATLAIGANDIVRGVPAETYRSHLATIFAVIGQTVPACRVLVLPQPDWSLSPAARSFGSENVIGASIRERNAILREEAEAHGARYLDLFPLMRSQAEDHMLAADGLHPSAPAYQAWADAIAAALQSDPLPAACR